MMQILPTKTFVLDIGRKCNINCRFCFVITEGIKIPDIITKTKKKRIDEVKLGEEILTVNPDNGKLVWTQINHVFENFTDSFFIIKTESGKMFYVTGEHPFYVSHKGWKEAKDLKVNDDLLYVRENETNRFRMQDNNPIVSNGDKIVSVQKVSLGDTFRTANGNKIFDKPLKTVNFSCSPYDTFLANNILVHNCYYRQLGDLRQQEWKIWGQLVCEVQKGIERGNNRVEITGGEPTLYPWIQDLIKGMKDEGLEVCIITNGIVSEEILKSIIDAGVDEFLISFHGTEETHDKLTIPGARKIQRRTLEILEEHENDLLRRFRFNFVINAWNQHEIMETAKEMSGWLPTIVNFINMNPLHSWVNSEETKNVIADLRIVEPQLNEAIEYLESITIDCNVRYYPMCRIDCKYWGNVVNDLLVAFDPKEWDYSITPKTFETHRQWGINTSNSNEEKGNPCNECSIHHICGGANKVFHQVSNKLFGELLTPVKDGSLRKLDFFHFFVEKRNLL